jgi:NAD-dependent SIR2 family protein deacetylase
MTAAASPPSADTLAEFVRSHPRLLVLTGAGCSVASGIPEYRDHDGAWKSRPPVRYAEFVSSPAVRRRYWARSMMGWTRVAEASPNAAHRSLARLEGGGYLRTLVTQNVDALHQRAGSRRVIDLHGRLDVVECLDCGGKLSRADVQTLLVAWNAAVAALLEAATAGGAPARPDGDAQVEADFSSFEVPDCPACGGVLKPAVVFFGENVPRGRVEAALAALAEADALLVLGSSLMVFSGYRFCLAAREMGKPIAAVNLGRTRADGILDLKVVADCGMVLPAMLAALGLETAAGRVPESAPAL